MKEDIVAKLIGVDEAEVSIGHDANHSAYAHRDGFLVGKGRWLAKIMGGSLSGVAGMISWSAGSWSEGC
jgi:ABC-type uncharacterized transport system permease subunit